MGTSASTSSAAAASAATSAASSAEHKSGSSETARPSSIAPIDTETTPAPTTNPTPLPTSDPTANATTKSDSNGPSQSRGLTWVVLDETLSPPSACDRYQTTKSSPFMDRRQRADAAIQASGRKSKAMPSESRAFDYLTDVRSSDGSMFQTGETDNHLINAALRAYNEHRPLVLRPDDILTCIAAVVSTYVNQPKTSEALRKSFVDHDGKKKLAVYQMSANWPRFVQLMAEKLKSQVKPVNGVNLPKVLTARYTTTTPASATAADIVLLSVFESYFTYEFVLACGLPAVGLEGTAGDWAALWDQYDLVKKALPELRWWYKQFDVVMKLLIDMKRLGEGRVDGSKEMKALWQRFATWVPKGSGSQRFLGGWIHLLFPFSSRGVPLVDEKAPLLPSLDLARQPPEPSKYGHYQYQDALERFFMTRGWSSISRSTASVGATFTTEQESVEITLESGFFAYELLPPNQAVGDTRGAVRPVIGWEVRPADKPRPKTKNPWDEEDTDA